MTTKKQGSAAPISPYKGWQTVSEAEANGRLSRQRIHVLVTQGRIPSRQIPGTSIKLVPKPLPAAKPPVLR